eukprot:CAMPEP_0170178254 /NCGR_PEP_ID=MMETSP0040_2-20121228/11766_1 /TAXON_ID=641309 /ORGANISM="Lotharella oceanica, Strain CCMP622" /LENGTH=180 /DNA_ID=CAMNT_0010421265 /DNA_START=78 /DNA_END=620 /DNA_ORIENTATION=-
MAGKTEIPFTYEEWLKTLRPNDQKALTSYFDGEEPDLEDMKMLVKGEMAPSFKPLSLNRVWKAIQAVVGPPAKAKVDTEAVKALSAKLEKNEHELRQRTAEKEKLFMQLSHLQRVYAQMLQENDSLKGQLRRAAAPADVKKDIWIPSKNAPPNMLPQGPGDKPKPSSSKFYRPDRASLHV